jgi:hypothetical protein
VGEWKGVRWESEGRDRGERIRGKSEREMRVRRVMGRKEGWRKGEERRRRRGM